MTRPPLYFTFGNHMHWVDMQWLWGYDVLPGSVSDMLALIEATGARGNVNFDAVGYERMAAECPEALAALRAAVAKGTVEPVGCSYGQPYGLFHGGESNVRQLTFGVRTTRRLLGVRARAFWEEEFYFFPQLPQMLAQCGYTGACLFFQWTWHTPEMPREKCPLILWEGLDGTRIPTLPRNELNVHQWPEDFAGLLEGPMIRGEGGGAMEGGTMEGGAPAVVQWLELMSSNDWMCRSEVLLPRLKELMADPRFEVRARTLSGVIEELHAQAEGGAGARAGVPVRRYGMDDVWHGVSLGKNGDNHPRHSRAVEPNILSAEAMSATMGLFGRPYPSWDVYPTWELDESWRELLAAQHHDNHECEGLCGFIADASFQRADQLAMQVASRTVTFLAGRVDAPAGSLVVFNSAGFPRDLYLTADDGRPPTIVKDVPPFGYAAVKPHAVARKPERINAHEERGELVLSRGKFRAMVDKRRGTVTQVVSPEFPEGMLAPDRPLGALFMVHGDGPDRFEKAEVELGEVASVPVVQVVRHARDGAMIMMMIKITPLTDSLDLTFISEHVPQSEARMHAGLQTTIAPAFGVGKIVTDHPYGQSAVEARGTFKRKYPTGDWMTSEQVFEEIKNPFTALSFVDLLEGDGTGRGVLCLHDGGEQFFREDGAGGGVRALLTMYDAWDEDQYLGRLQARLSLTPHGPMSAAQRARTAASTLGNWSVAGRDGDPGDIPATFGALWIEDAPTVIATALFRESMKSGEHLPQWAGHRMAAESGGACTHPYVVRLVEWEGHAATVTLKLPGAVGSCAKTNLLGEVCDGTAGKGERGGEGWSSGNTQWLKVEPAEPPAWARGANMGGAEIPWSQVRFAMRPHEIATIMADLVMGRKQFRNLDAKREVWATVHKERGAAG